MARGRMMSATVASDLRLNSLSLAAHCAYMMAVPHLDRDGIMAGHPNVVAGKICPLRADLCKKISKIIKEWIDSGLVFEFSTENGSALYFVGFQKNQSLGAIYAREAKSEFPPPPGYTRTEHGLVPIDNEELMTNSRPTHELVMSRSRNGHAEDQVKDQDQDQSSSSLPSSFAQNEKTDDEDGDLESVLVSWQENMPGEMTPILKGKITKLVKECTAANVIHGISVAIEHNKQSFAYVASVARNHAGGREPPGRKPGHSKLSDAERSALLTRANNARSSIRTAEQFGGNIDPTWQRDIEIAKGHGLI